MCLLHSAESQPLRIYRQLDRQRQLQWQANWLRLFGEASFVRPTAGVRCEAARAVGLFETGLDVRVDGVRRPLDPEVEAGARS